MEFYVQHDGHPIGPLSEEEILAKVGDGSLSETDLAMVPETTSWHPLANFIVREPTADETSFAGTPGGNTAQHHGTLTENLTHVLKDGVQTGPFADTDVIARLRNGALAPSDLAWRDGLSNWQTLGTLYPSEKRSVASQPPPPPISPPVASSGMPVATKKPGRSIFRSFLILGVAFTLLIVVGVVVITLVPSEDEKDNGASAARSRADNHPADITGAVEVMFIKTVPTEVPNWTEVTNQVTNRSNKTISLLNLQIRAVDQRGVVIDDASEIIKNLAPGKAVQTTAHLTSANLDHLAKLNASINKAFAIVSGRDQAAVFQLKVVPFDEAAGNVTSIESAKKVVPGIWTGRRADLCLRLVINADGSYEEYTPPISADGWGEPRRGKWEAFTEKYDNTGKRYYGLNLSTGAYVIVESSTQMRNPNLDVKLTKGDSFPFSK